jgi:hypothetical protein
MSQPKQLRITLLLVAVILLLVTATSTSANPPELKRAVIPKQVLRTIPADAEAELLVIKLAEGMGQPELRGRSFSRAGADWDRLNDILASNSVEGIRSRIGMDKATLDEMRLEGSRRLGRELPDLTLYYELPVNRGLSIQGRQDLLNRIMELDIIETAYFAPKPDLATTTAASSAAPAYEAQQYYLQAAPVGINAYHGWGFPGGHGESVKVIDIEGNWTETHEDLHGGTDTWHIAGTLINDPGWWNHGTAVLGEIAADSNDFGMTGIAYNVDLGTVSIGSMSTAQAVSTASANAGEGDIILIELHAPGPHYDFKSFSDQRGYVAMEYWQEVFDAILTASALGQIVVEAAGNGNEDYDDTSIYDSLFYPEYRFSGAVMVGASCADHTPASFTNYGIRIDVHGFGCWDVYTLGYGNLYGTTRDDAYTDSFSGTSSASPIIVGACAVLQGIHKAAFGTTLDHAGMRDLLTTYSTPQATHYKRIGPMPDLFGSCNSLAGSCCANRGDADHNGALDILDIEFLIDWLYRTGAEPQCMDEADADASNQADVLDVEYLINYLFLTGPEPTGCQ